MLCCTCSFPILHENFQDVLGGVESVCLSCDQKSKSGPLVKQDIYPKRHSHNFVFESKLFCDIFRRFLKMFLQECMSEINCIPFPNPETANTCDCILFQLCF